MFKKISQYIFPCEIHIIFCIVIIPYILHILHVYGLFHLLSVHLADVWIHGMYVCVIRCGSVQSFNFILNGRKGINKSAFTSTAIFVRGGEKYFHTLNVVYVEFCFAILMNFNYYLDAL